ncbi:DUF4400 domain-containing protein [Ralstonia nicotianae]|uniref:DUF4400 domain-containing protein n=1 Tax=Ralstonia pseudosolanacearum TaxID=1310165 RepID=UPI002003A2CE|nr:DUF4400 domain-containing protein [Ralstonia pseudosolanacearum]MCK4118416.1 DUF4400 domain-containing protein [Ralstonia pseudosolanacearum]
MADSRFASHIRLWLIAAPLLLCVGSPMLDGDGNFEITDQEIASVEACLGLVRTEHITDRTNAVFQRWLVESGAMKGWASTASSSTTDIPDAGTVAFSSAWMRHFWMSMYRALFRANVLLSWIAGGAVFALAMLNDGAISRRIKAAAAGFASPVAFHLAAHAAVIALGVGTAALLLPVPLSAFWWSGAVLILGLLAWRMAASFHVGR